MNDIVYVTDDNFVLPTKVSITSILRNIRDAELTVHVLAIGVSDENKRSLSGLGSGNVKVEVVDSVNPFHGMTHHPYISSAMLLRFNLPDLFPGLDRILYIDGDTTVYAGLGELFETDLSGHYAAVVKDPSSLLMPDLTRVNKTHYFSSGVMYLNLEKCRAENIPQVLAEEFRRSHAGDDPFPDQTVLNAVFGSNVATLHPRFNLMLRAVAPEFIRQYIPEADPLKTLAGFYGISEAEMKDARDNPAIIHYTGGEKPWNTADALRADEWLRYVSPEDHFEILKVYCAEMSKSLHTARRQIDALNELSLKRAEVLRQHELCIQNLSKENLELRKLVNEVRGIGPIGVYIELRNALRRRFGGK